MPATRQSVLKTLNFGSRTAEDEQQGLADYFVETDQWGKLLAGEVDIVYGAKGSGKSALFFLLKAKEATFAGQGVSLIAGENPRGATVFQELATEPPVSERQFVNLWKLYLLSLIGGAIREREIKNPDADALLGILRDAGLIESEGGLRSILKTVLVYVRRFSGLEAGLSLDPVTGAPSGITGRIVFEQPSTQQRLSGLSSVDDLFESADRVLRDEKHETWVLLDRLDVAFSETPDLEKNALRALFKTYLDLQSYTQIKLKIFLRSDIWTRLTVAGFREASHITRAVTLKWDRTSLLNLISLRALRSSELREFYSVDEQLLKSVKDQETLFYWMFPDKVESGSNKSRTLDWLLSHTQDGTRQTAPRELIHLLNCIRDAQSKQLQLGQTAPENNELFTRTAIKEGMPEVSQARLEQTLYAEYPSLKPKCEALRGEKSAQTTENLAACWGMDSTEALIWARKLVEVGFFEERIIKEQTTFWVPFLYRYALELVQGTATD
jgi:hypothetical protein